MGPSCQRLAWEWDAVQGAAGYRYYLDGQDISDRGGTKEPGLTRLVLGLLTPDTSYRLEVSAYDAGGDESPCSEVDARTLPCAPLKEVYLVPTLLVRFADYPDAPLSAEQMAERMYAPTGSVNAYFHEVSFGRTRIEGEVHDWRTTARPAADYHDRGLEDGHWWGLDIDMLADEVATLFPGARDGADAVVVVVHGTGDAGYSAGLMKYLSARTGPDRSGIIHELGHSLSREPGQAQLGHPAGWLCPDEPVGPSLDDTTEGDCIHYIYGHEPFDPMGAGSTRHLMAYHKWLLGMIPEERVADAKLGATCELHALERTTGGVQMLRIPIAKDRFYFLEYRRPIGLDGAELHAEEPQEEPIDGVLARIRVDDAVATASTLLPTWRRAPVVINPGEPFEDRYRGLRIEVLEKEGDVATVRVSGIGCGCAQARASTAWTVALFYLVALRRRRRQSADHEGGPERPKYGTGCTSATSSCRATCSPSAGSAPPRCPRVTRCTAASGRRSGSREASRCPPRWTRKRSGPRSRTVFSRSSWSRARRRCPGRSRSRRRDDGTT